MSYDRIVAVVAQLAVSADGAFLGVGVAYVAYRCIQKYTQFSSARLEIQSASEVKPTDLRTILSGYDDREDGVGSGKLVIVRGVVEAAKGDRKGNSFVISPQSGEKGVVLEQSQTCVYNEWRRAFAWTSDLWSIISSSWGEKQSLILKKVPFVLVDPGNPSLPDFVLVNLEGSTHPLPLKAVYQDFQATGATPFSIFCALAGIKYPVGVLYEEKILPFGKEITAIGICRPKDHGTLEIESCDDLPYFLSEKTKSQMVSDISLKMKVLMCSGLVLGSLAVGILGYSMRRHWRRWKERRHLRSASSSMTSQAPPPESTAEEDSGDVPDGELCVVCVMHRRRVAFTPCGHLVCCQRCAFTIERETTPLCPVCRQSVRGSVRVYVS